MHIIMRALNLILEGAQQFSFGKGHFYEENVNLFWYFAKGTSEIAVGAMGYLRPAYDTNRT